VSAPQSGHARADSRTRLLLVELGGDVDALTQLGYSREPGKQGVADELLRAIAAHLASHEALLAKIAARREKDEKERFAVAERAAALAAIPGVQGISAEDVTDADVERLRRRFHGRG
jgi:RNA-binding protein YhbY